MTRKAIGVENKFKNIYIYIFKKSSFLKDGQAM